VTLSDLGYVPFGVQMIRYLAVASSAIATCVPCSCCHTILQAFQIGMRVMMMFTGPKPNEFPRSVPSESLPRSRSRLMRVQ